MHDRIERTPYPLARHLDVKREGTSSSFLLSSLLLNCYCTGLLRKYIYTCSFEYQHTMVILFYRSFFEAMWQTNTVSAPTWAPTSPEPLHLARLQPSSTPQWRPRCLVPLSPRWRRSSDSATGEATTEGSILEHERIKLWRHVPGKLKNEFLWLVSFLYFLFCVRTTPFFLLRGVRIRRCSANAH